VNGQTSGPTAGRKKTTNTSSIIISGKTAISGTQILEITAMGMGITIKMGTITAVTEIAATITGTTITRMVTVKIKTIPTMIMVTQTVIIMVVLASLAIKSNMATLVTTTVEADKITTHGRAATITIAEEATAATTTIRTIMAAIRRIMAVTITVTAIMIRKTTIMIRTTAVIPVNTTIRTTCRPPSKPFTKMKRVTRLSMRIKPQMTSLPAQSVAENLWPIDWRNTRKSVKKCL